MRYIYGLRFRPFGIGTAPRGQIEVIEGKKIGRKRYYDFVIYDKQLSEEEVKKYELDFIGDEEANKIWSRKWL